MGGTVAVAVDGMGVLVGVAVCVGVAVGKGWRMSGKKLTPPPETGGVAAGGKRCALEGAVRLTNSSPKNARNIITRRRIWCIKTQGGKSRKYLPIDGS